MLWVGAFVSCLSFVWGFEGVTVFLLPYIYISQLVLYHNVETLALIGSLLHKKRVRGRCKQDNCRLSVWGDTLPRLTLVLLLGLRRRIPSVRTFS